MLAALLLAVLAPGRTTDLPTPSRPTRFHVGPLDGCPPGTTTALVNEAETLCIRVDPPLRLPP